MKRPQSFENWPTCARRSQRRGMTALQFTLLMPVFLLLTIAVLQFSILGSVEVCIESAAAEGAKEAALGQDLNRITEVVNRLLAAQNVQVTANGDVVILVEAVDGRGRRTVDRVGRSSLAELCVPQGPHLLPHEVRVTVCVQIRDSQGPVPNWLGFFGIPLEGRLLQASALRVSERSLGSAIH